MGLPCSRFTTKLKHVSTASNIRSAVDSGSDAAGPSVSLQRLTARSVLLSVLLGTDGAWLPTPLLLSTTALFGIADGTSRTALSRMSAAGEVEATGRGYRIVSGDLLARQHRQATGRSGERRTWDGSWRQVIVGVGERRSAGDRAATRTALGTARFGELREGVWLRPDNLAPSEAVEPWADSPDTLSATVARIDGDDAELATRLWDLDGWAGQAAGLIGDMTPMTRRLERGDAEALAESFMINAAVLRLLAADPLLPDRLAPTRWPGHRLRDDYERFDAAFRHVITEHFARHADR